MRVFSPFSPCVDVFTSQAAVAAVAVLKSLPLASVYEHYRTPDRVWSGQVATGQTTAVATLQGSLAWAAAAYVCVPGCLPASSSVWLWLFYRCK